MSKIIVVINWANKTKFFSTIGACLDKTDTYVISYSIISIMLVYWKQQAHGPHRSPENSSNQ